MSADDRKPEWKDDVFEQVSNSWK